MHRAQLPRAQARRGDPKDPGSIAYEGTHNHEPPTGSNRGKKRKSVDQNSNPPLSPNSKAMKMKTTKKSSSHRSSELQNVTPRFWERAEALAMETLGSLSPGSRKMAAKLTSSRNKRKSGNGLAVQVPDLISGGAPTSITAALVRVDSGDVTNISGDVTNISGFTNMEIPASARTGNTRVSPRSKKNVGESDRGANGELKSVRSKPGNHVPVGGGGARAAEREAQGWDQFEEGGRDGVGVADAEVAARDPRVRGKRPHGVARVHHHPQVKASRSSTHARTNERRDPRLICIKPRYYLFSP